MPSSCHFYSIPVKDFKTKSRSKAKLFLALKADLAKKSYQCLSKSRERVSKQCICGAERKTACGKRTEKTGPKGCSLTKGLLLCEGQCHTPIKQSTAKNLKKCIKYGTCDDRVIWLHFFELEKRIKINRIVLEDLLVYLEKVVRRGCVILTSDNNYCRCETFTKS